MKTSVILCAYNGSQFIYKQLESIFNQSQLPDEVIISDDGSTDATIRIIDEYKVKFPLVIFIYKRNQPIGPLKNFSFAAEHATSDIIFFSDQDDIWLPNKIAILKEELARHPEMDAIFTDALLIDENDSFMGSTMMESIGVKEADQFYFEIGSLFPYMLKTGNIVTGATMAIRKTALKQLLPFKSFYGEYHDEYMAMKLAGRKKIHYHSTPLIQYRIHSSQQVGTAKESERNFYLNRRKSIWMNDFGGLDRETAIYAAWRYLVRARHYCTYPDSEDLLSEAETTFKRIRSEYLSPLSFIRKKKVLMDWRKRKAFDITWSKVFTL